MDCYIRLHMPMYNHSHTLTRTFAAVAVAAGDGHLRFQLPAAHGHDGARVALRAAAAGDDSGDGAPVLLEAALGSERGGGHHVLQRVQPGGLAHDEPVRDRQGLLQVQLLQDV